MKKAGQLPGLDDIVLQQCQYIRGHRETAIEN
jgi:hypothetical protein